MGLRDRLPHLPLNCAAGAVARRPRLLETNNQNERQNMKNQNKVNAGRTQIADISVAGKELSEEHLRIAGGSLPRAGLWNSTISITQHCVPGPSCTVLVDGKCRDFVVDSFCGS